MGITLLISDAGWQTIGELTVLAIFALMIVMGLRS